MTKTSPAQIRAGAKYDKSNTRGLYLKLNEKTDRDIISHLATVQNKQGYIKDLIRADMDARQKADS